MTKHEKTIVSEFIDFVESKKWTWNIWQTADKDGFAIQILHAEIKGDCMLRSAYGAGETIEEAILDYFGRLWGKTIVIDALDPDNCQTCSFGFDFRCAKSKGRG